MPKTDVRSYLVKRGHTHSNLSTIVENITDKYELLWIDMLMQIPGISE